MSRVLLAGFCAVPGPRRAGVQLRHVIRALTPFHSLDLLVMREGDQPYVERQGSVRVLRVPTQDADPKAQVLSFQRALKRQLDGADYDVVHCRDSWSAQPVLEARDRLGFAVVYDLSRSPLGDSTLDPELAARHVLDEQACLASSDLVLAPTPAAVAALQARVKPGRVMLSPPGVDVDRFDWDAAPVSGVPRIVYTGSLDPGRGLGQLLGAMSAIVRERDARLVLAGPSAPETYEAALLEQVRQLGLTDKVDVLGPVDHDQLPALIATATVCVVPEIAESTTGSMRCFPTKLLEYMACKRAVIAPRHDVVADVVEDGRDALLFASGDAAGLARAALRLLGDAPLRDRLAEAGYARVRRDFTASGARRALRTAYQVLSERFADRFADEPVDEAPKVEMLADDDFETTVMEEMPSPLPADLGLRRIEGPEAIDVAIASGIARPRATLAEHPVSDETAPRAVVASGGTGGWRDSGLTQAQPAEDWGVTGLSAAMRSLDQEAVADDGGDEETPVGGGGVAPLSVQAPSGRTFAAGEIDVRSTHGADAAAGRAAAGALLGAPEAADPDTGSRTPPVEPA